MKKANVSIAAADAGQLLTHLQTVKLPAGVKLTLASNQATSIEARTALRDADWIEIIITAATSAGIKKVLDILVDAAKSLKLSRHPTVVKQAKKVGSKGRRKKPKSSRSKSS